MEVGAVFLLLVVGIVVVLAGGAFLALTGRLRKRQLDPREDRVEGPGAADGDVRGREPSRPLSEPGDDARRRSARPEHVKVESKQRTRFIGSR